MLINQLSDADMVTVEITNGSSKFILVSMYLDRENQIELDLVKIEAANRHAKGSGVLIAKHSNSRSTLWHDKLTNARGRILKEFITSQQLHILNKESNNTTFRNRIGGSNIDLTLITDHLLHRISRWEISDQESSSDHSTIIYVINQSASHAKPVNLQDGAT